MKSKLAPSKNVEVRPRTSAYDAPHANPRTNPFLEAFRMEDAMNAKFDGMQTLKKAVKSKNAFSDMIKSMDKTPVKKVKGANIPIPTPRPDPSKPYKKPTVFNYSNNKG